MMSRGIMPAWMEILKLNLPKESREKTFSSASAISYIVMAFLAIFFGKWMDTHPGSWKILFPITAFLSLGRMYFQYRIPIPEAPIEKTPLSTDLRTHLSKPWKNLWHLFKTRPDFVRFQIGFMLGGGGLMIMQPALPLFFDTILHMSYTELAIALSICKGIGFAATSRIWAKWMHRQNIYRFSSFVTLLACLFPLGLLLGQIELAWVYAAYLIYGIMQAGSELSWHLSGPIFAKEEDSSSFSSVNVITVGIRGLFAPFLGSLFCGLFGPISVLIFGGILCALSSLQLRMSDKQVASYEKNP